MSKKIYLIIFFLPVGLAEMQAQCIENLRRARVTYEEGHLHRIEQELTEDCLGSGSTLNEEEKSEAYRLLILSYLYQDLPNKADEAMLALLRTNPRFKINPETDPNELINLYKTFRTDPIFRYGFKVAVNYSVINVLETHTVTNTLAAEGKYTGNINFGGEAFIEKDYLNKNIILRATPNFYINRFTYASHGFPADKEVNKNIVKWTENIETQTWVGLRLSARHTFLKKSKIGKKINPQIILGGSSQFLLSSSASNKTDIEKGESASGADLDYLALEHRKRINLSAIAGIGFVLSAGNNYFVMDITYNHGLLNITDKHNSPTLNFLYGRAQNKISISSINVSLGLMFDRFNPKKLTK